MHSSHSLFHHVEDFLKYPSTVTDTFGYRHTAGSGGSDSVIEEENGFLRLASTTATTADSMAAWGRVLRPDRGGQVHAEGILRASNVADGQIFFGLSDATTETGGVVIEDEDGTLNTAPTDAVGFLLEGEQDATWQAIAVKNGADSPQTLLTKGADAVAGVLQVLRLEVNEKGDVWFFIDGEEVLFVEEMIRPNIVYCAVFANGGRGTAYNADLDLICFGGVRKGLARNIT